MRKEKSRSPPKRSNGRLPLILACLPTTCKNTDSQGCEAFILPFTDVYKRQLEEGAKAIFHNVAVQRCIGHLIRNAIKYVPNKDYKRFTAQLRCV